MTGDFERDAGLVLVMTHPTDAAQDLRLPLARTTTGWTASAADPDVDTSTSPLSLSNNHSPWTSGWPSTG